MLYALQYLGQIFFLCSVDLDAVADVHEVRNIDYYVSYTGLLATKIDS